MASKRRSAPASAPAAPARRVTAKRPAAPAPATTPENLNPFEFAQLQFDRAADHLGLDAS